MKKEMNIPQKGAAKKWSERLKRLGNQPPPQNIVDRLNGDKDNEKKIARSRNPSFDVET